jgi:hypothetical protein
MGDLFENGVFCLKKQFLQGPLGETGKLQKVIGRKLDTQKDVKINMGRSGKGLIQKIVQT